MGARVTLVCVSGGLTIGGAGIGLTVVGVMMAAAGLALVVVGVLGRRRRLPRNRFAGVRTAATLRDDETFAVGNEVSAPLTLTAGAVAVVAGAAAALAPSPLAGWVLAGLGFVGMLVFALVGGVIGDRASTLAAPLETLVGCTGSCIGCSLVAGCGTADAGTAEAGTADIGTADSGQPAGERFDAASS